VLFQNIATDNNDTHGTRTVHYLPFTSLKGNIRIAPMSLNSASSVNPTILKGRRISQIKGNKKISTSAKGQQITNKMHQRIRAMSVLMDKVFSMACKSLAKG
jgi:hypothetical protein